MSTSITTRLWACTFFFGLACGEATPVALDGGVGSADASVDASAPRAPTIVSFTTSADRVRAGEAVRLEYQVTEATSVRLLRDSGGASTVLYTGAPSRTPVDSGALAEAATFRLEVTGPGGSAERRLMVAVDMVEPDLVIRSFTATPNPAERASTVVVRWEVEGATRVRVREGFLTLVDTSTSVASGQLSLRVVEGPRKLQLEALREDQSVTTELELRTRDPARVVRFLARPAVFTEASAAVRLRWDTRGEAVTLAADGDPVGLVDAAALTSSVVLDVSEPTVFALEVRGLGRRAVARRVVAPRAITEREPDDERTLAQPITGGVLGELTSSTDADYYRVQVPAGGHLYAELSEPGERCTRGVGLRLLDAVGDERAEQDSGDRDDCARLDPFEDPGLRDLPAGDYYLVVDGAVGRTPYGLAVVARGPTCGNGLLERARGEQCDDGGTAASDGCSAACMFELSDTLTLPGPEAVRSGALAAAEVDYYGLIVTQPVVVTLETGAPAVGLCDTPGADTVLVVLDSAQQQVARSDDTLGLCAAITARSGLALAAGSYTVAVRSYDPTRALARYGLRVASAVTTCGDDVVASTEACDDGNTVGGDGCSATCTVEQLSAPGGRLLLDVPARAVRVVDVVLTRPGQSITATTSDGQGACGVDTRLVVARDGVFLGYESSGAGCARIGPRTHGFVADLEPGVYRVYVVGEGTSGGPVTLDVGVMEPACGNGVRETRAQEMCDDGNTIDGDGCTAQCQRVLGGVARGPGGPPVTFGGTIAGPGDRQLFGIELMDAANVFVEVGIPVIGQCTSGDPVAELYDASMNLVTANDDSFGLCSYIDPVTNPQARVPAGRYTLAIRAFDNVASLPTFEVRIELRAVGCGNAIVEAGESCDDGNTGAGDGCSPVCQPE